MDFIDPGLLAVLPGFIVLGLVVGFCAGLLGIGGGLILVPGLYYLLKTFGDTGGNENVLMHTALATSMSIIIPTGLSSSWAQIKRKAVDWSAVKLMVPGLVIGASLGVILVSRMDSNMLKMIFAVGLYGIVLSIIKKRDEAKPNLTLRKPLWAVPVSMAFGVAATLLGIGGAVLNVPYLNKSGTPLKNAIATGSVLGVIVAFPATVGYIIAGHGTLGYINAAAFAMIVPVSVLIAPLGVKASHALPVHKLKILFAGLLILVATKMLIELI